MTDENVEAYEDVIIEADDLKLRVAAIQDLCQIVTLTKHLEKISSKAEDQLEKLRKQDLKQPVVEMPMTPSTMSRDVSFLHPSRSTDIIEVTDTGNDDPEEIERKYSVTDPRELEEILQGSNNVLNLETIHPEKLSPDISDEDLVEVSHENTTHLGIITEGFLETQPKDVPQWLEMEDDSQMTDLTQCPTGRECCVLLTSFEKPINVLTQSAGASGVDILLPAAIPIGSKQRRLEATKSTDTEPDVISSTPEAEKYFRKQAEKLFEKNFGLEDDPFEVTVGPDISRQSDLLVEPLPRQDSTSGASIHIEELTSAPSLEVRPVLDNPLSSFEALYDSTQAEAISSDRRLTSEELKNVLGDRFHGTFQDQPGGSSFENIYTSGDLPLEGRSSNILPNVRWSAPVNEEPLIILGSTNENGQTPNQHSEDYGQI